MRNFTALILIIFFLSACATNEPYTPTLLSNEELVATTTLTPEATTALSPEATLTNTPEPTKTNTPSPIPTYSSPHGKVVFHEPDENINYGWFSYIPNNLDYSETVYIWVTGLQGWPPTDDYEEIIEWTKGDANWNKTYANKYNVVMIEPAIPRPSTNYAYVVAFDKQVFYSRSDYMIQRPDIQVNLMIDELLGRLSSDGYDVNEKIFMSGYSAGGMFTQRYALLHPERLLAISAGQCGGYLTLPVPHYDNYRLDWPLGINDFDSLTGQSFDMDAYKNIPQFIYVGDLETDNSHSMLLWEPGFYNGWSYVNFINSTFGENDRDRLQGEINFLLANGFNNFEFVIYPNTAHEYTTQMIIDTFNFFEKNK